MCFICNIYSAEWAQVTSKSFILRSKLNIEEENRKYLLKITYKVKYGEGEGGEGEVDVGGIHWEARDRDVQTHNIPSH